MMKNKIDFLLINKYGSILEYKYNKVKADHDTIKRNFYCNIDIDRFSSDVQYSKEIVKMHDDIKEIDRGLATLKELL